MEDDYYESGPWRLGAEDLLREWAVESDHSAAGAARTNYSMQEHTAVFQQLPKSDAVSPSYD